MEAIKYPEIKIKLVGEDGNAFAILGRVKKALHKANVPGTEIDKFFEEATSGDYNRLLATCVRWISVS